MFNKLHSINHISNKKNHGMTLVEIVVAMSIMVVVMIAVVAFEYNVLDYNRYSQVTLSNVQDATNILKYMSRELRTMSPSANGSYPILSAATSSITFYSDIEGNGTKEQIRYYLSSTTLYRGVTEPSGSPQTYNLSNESTSIIVTGVRNATSSALFEYFNSSYSGSGLPLTYPMAISSIRLVKINITIDSDPRRSPVPITYSTQVSLRNLKDNI
jgi:prepilin-type N-terminal cleavage/methylation domain-containing protein